jgi:hypothetical protein
MARTTKTETPVETRGETIARTVSEEFAKGTALAAVRRILAGILGGDPSTFLGTADPIYYRLAGLASPLSTGKVAASTKTGEPSAALRVALRKRRDSGVRWETVAASAEATLGRRVTVAEAKALYARAGGDLSSSYAGRGTRVGAPATYAATDAAVRSAV